MQVYPIVCVEVCRSADSVYRLLNVYGESKRTAVYAVSFSSNWLSGESQKCESVIRNKLELRLFFFMIISLFPVLTFFGLLLVFQLNYFLFHVPGIININGSPGTRNL